MSLRRLFHALALGVLWHCHALAAEPATQTLQAGLPGFEAAAHMSVPEGFCVELSAAEPTVHQPIALTIDHRGRLWVAEAFTYPVRAPEGQGRDKIVILDDTDDDGYFETRKVFAEGLNLVSGLEIGFGGVWVGAAPYLLFIPDKDGDDRPDGPPQVLLDGFGYQDTHETLNAFIWGPDGWLYGCHGVFTHSRVGKPGTRVADRTPMNAAVWRYHPTRHEFEIFSYGTSNPWGIDFNDHGHAFITACVIPHLWHVIQGARYERQGGQHFSPYIYEDIATIARHRHYAGNIRDHAWWGKEPEPPADTLAAGGGHAHCGAMIYLADNWPAEYRDQIFMHNVHGNRINNDRLERHGSGYAGDRAPDLLLANDKWFRGINLKYGPDGSVYLIDWYDRNACHRNNPEIWDRTNGRIYNVAYGRPQSTTVDLAEMDDDQLVDLQQSSNDWFVRTARRLLQERAATGTLQTHRVHSRLWEMAQQPSSASRRLRAIWALHVTGGLDETRRTQLLSDIDENVRGWGVQLELEDRRTSSEQRSRLADMARTDDSALVRVYLASALQRIPLQDRWKVADGLVLHSEDSPDHNLPLMIWYGIEPLVPSDVAKALKLAESCQIPKVRTFIIRRAAEHPEGLNTLLTWSCRIHSEQQMQVLDQIRIALEGRVGTPMPTAWKRAFDQFSRSDNTMIRQRAAQVAVVFGDKRVFPRMRSVLSDAGQDPQSRKQALEILMLGRDDQAAPAIQSAIEAKALRGAAIRALANLDDSKTPAVLIANYARFDEQEKRDAISTLTARPAYARSLLTAIENGIVPPVDLHAYNVRQILSFNDQHLHDRLTEVWGAIRETSDLKKVQVDRYKQLCDSASSKDADLSNGRRVFSLTCASCHRLFGQGSDVGPDITGSNRANVDYILQNIVDPSAVLGNDYRMTILELGDGRVVSGLVLRETDSALTIRTLNDTLVIAKTDVDDRSLSPLSMMPEGLLDRIPEQDIRDLIAYLGSPTQVPLQGPSAPIDSSTGRVEGALEGEQLLSAVATTGNAESQRMEPVANDRWSDNAQLRWTGGGPQDSLSVELSVKTAGSYVIDLVLTRAPDYAIVQLVLDGRRLAGPIDLYGADVMTTGVLQFAAQELDAGTHELRFEIVGANPKAKKAYTVGVDYIRLRPSP